MAKRVDGQPGHRMVKETENWAVKVDKKTVARIIELHDEWATSLGVAIDYEKNKVTRRLAGERDDELMPIGLYMSVALVAEIVGTEAADRRDGMVYQYQRRKTEIACFSVTQGITKVSLEGLLTAYPNTQPSLSLVGLLALTLGLKDFSKHFAPTPGREKHAGKKARLVKQEASA